jgi:hypothetical protein
MTQTTLWLVTIGAALAAATIVGAYRLAVARFRRTAVPTVRRDRGICIYLHEKTVMNIYLQGDYEALSQVVEETTRSDREGSVTGQFGGLGGRLGQKTAREILTKYIKEAGPITVIGRIITAFERADDIVYANLITRTLEPGRALDRALSAHGRNAARWRSARLHDLDPFVYVSITGRFRVTGETDTTTTLSAPYGEPTDAPDRQQHVSVTCETSQLLEKVPAGPFSARCLGRIQNWDPATRELTIDPVIAIFH